MTLLVLHESTAHPTWTNLDTYCAARVMLHHATKPPRFMAECHLDFGDDERTQWGSVVVFDTQAEADEHARLWWSIALPLWRESLVTRKAPETPGNRLARACAAHVEALPDVVKARAKVADLTAQRVARGFEPGWEVLSREVAIARDVATRLECAAERAFYAAHLWVEFIEAAPAPPPERGQLALFGTS